jgi:hypothetical protein
MAEQDEAVKSTALRDMEDRMALDLGETPPSDLPARDFSGGRDPKELDGFVGVSAEYRNFGNEQDRPLFSDDDGGAEAYFEQKHTDNSDAIVSGRPDEDDEEDDEDADKDDDKDKAPVSKAPAKKVAAPVVKSS